MEIVMLQMNSERRRERDLEWHATFYRTPLSNVQAAHERVAQEFSADRYKALEKAERAAARQLEEQPGGPHAVGVAPSLRRARYIALRCHADYLVRKCVFWRT